MFRKFRNFAIFRQDLKGSKLEILRELFLLKTFAEFSPLPVKGAAEHHVTVQFARGAST